MALNKVNGAFYTSTKYILCERVKVTDTQSITTTCQSYPAYLKCFSTKALVTFCFTVP